MRHGSALSFFTVCTKVRFVKKGNLNGRITRKLKWYGGVIAGTANGGRRVRIKYDDGTAEVADFPDKDIIIDAECNGRHLANAAAFRPPTPSPDNSDDDDDVENVSSVEVASESADSPKLPDSERRV